MCQTLSRPWLVLAILLVSVTPATAKSYSAERFDSIVRVQQDGTLDVTETIVFHFQDGTFQRVFREIPRRRTDGIDVIWAEMDGRRLPIGKEPGMVEIGRGSGRVRVVWRFAPVAGGTKEFVLHYRVRGAVRQTETADVLMWRALPGDHDYRIASSTIRFELPIPSARAPELRTNDAEAPQVTVEGSMVRVQAAGIKDDGWIETTLQFPRGSLIAAAPAWQQRSTQAAAFAGTWVLVAGGVLAAGLVLLLAWRQGYDAPAREFESSADAHQTMPPDPLAPAMGGALASNASVSLHHAMAAIFALADRGEIDIREQPGGMFGQRNFLLTLRNPADRLSGHERAALDIIFQSRTSAGESVALAKARSRLTHGLSKFATEVKRELAASGFLDQDRTSLRRRYNTTGIALLIVGAAAFLPAALLGFRFDGWPLFVPGAILAVAIAAFILGASITPLSNDGLRRAHRWRAYRKHLSQIAQEKSASSPAAGLLTFAVSLGLAGAWSKYLKQHRHAAPAWFHALSAGDDSAAFPAFVAAGGTPVSGDSSGGGGSGGGGAAGGGSSGAS